MFTDQDGTELPDMESARREAIRFAAALLRDQADRFGKRGEWRMRVTNDAQLPLFGLTLSTT